MLLDSKKHLQNFYCIFSSSRLPDLKISNFYLHLLLQGTMPGFHPVKKNTHICSDEGLALETSPIVSLTASITLINTQLIHQFAAFRRADAVT